MFGMIGLFVACSFSTEVEQEAIGSHSQWSELRKEYQKAISLYHAKDYTAAVIDFRSLHSQYPHSRAVLEGLLMAELYSEQYVQDGYIRIQEYVQRHPGDMDFRLLQVKFHLHENELEQAHSDLELLLFNQTFHPWVLAQDPFLQAFKNEINLEHIPFDLIRLLDVGWPDSAIVGDTVEFVCLFYIWRLVVHIYLL